MARHVWHQGMDSLSAVEFRNRFTGKMPGPAGCRPEGCGYGQDVAPFGWLVGSVSGWVTGPLLWPWMPFLGKLVGTPVAGPGNPILKSFAMGKSAAYVAGACRVNLPNTLIFDYPTISAIADFTTSQMGPATAAPVPSLQRRWGATSDVHENDPSLLEEVKELLKRIASDTTGGLVEDEKPLMESGDSVDEFDQFIVLTALGSEILAGMDSLSAVEFRNRLSSELPNLDLPNTLIFDYPTISSVASYASEQLGATVPMSGGVARAGPVSGGLDQQLSVAGMGVDGQVEIPFTRWELEEVWDPNPDAQGKMQPVSRARYPRHGAFIEGVECFDAKFFGISPPEAQLQIDL
eukprot:Skav203410  [mRNA]  locus=scaffold1743:228308:235239:- [translate_table: standard]